MSICWQYDRRCHSYNTWFGFDFEDNSWIYVPTYYICSRHPYLCLDQTLGIHEKCDHSCRNYSMFYRLNQLVALSSGTQKTNDLARYTCSTSSPLIFALVVLVVECNLWPNDRLPCT